MLRILESIGDNARTTARHEKAGNNAQGVSPHNYARAVIPARQSQNPCIPIRDTETFVTC